MSFCTHNVGYCRNGSKKRRCDIRLPIYPHDFLYQHTYGLLSYFTIFEAAGLASQLFPKLDQLDKVE